MDYWLKCCKFKVSNLPWWWPCDEGWFAIAVFAANKKMKQTNFQLENWAPILARLYAGRLFMFLTMLSYELIVYLKYDILILSHHYLNDKSFCYPKTVSPISHQHQFIFGSISSPKLSSITWPLTTTASLDKLKKHLIVA